MILGIETATARLGVALYDPRGMEVGPAAVRHAPGSAHTGTDGLRALVTINRGSVHDELLVPLCQELLRHGGVGMDALSAVAVSAGPGSFTGLRIGMAAAKGFALGRGIPLRIVPTLDAAAEWCVRNWPPRAGSVLAVCLDARREDVFAATYIHEGSDWRAADPVRVHDANALAERLPDGAILCGDGAAKVHAVAHGRLWMPAHPEACLDAGAVAMLGARLLSQDGPSDAETCEPLYAREFQVHRAPTPFS